MLGTTKKTSYFQDTLGGKAMIDLSLLKAIVRQIEEDASCKDYTAIEDLLKDIPKEKLIAFLSEEKQ